MCISAVCGIGIIRYTKGLCVYIYIKSPYSFYYFKYLRVLVCLNIDSPHIKFFDNFEEGGDLNFLNQLLELVPYKMKINHTKMYII